MLTNKLQRSSVKTLQLKSQEILESKSPNVVIFGSCYTYYSIVKSIMTAYGLFSALAVAAEKGQCTDGLSFEFDDQQRDLLSRFVQVPNC